MRVASSLAVAGKQFLKMLGLAKAWGGRSRWCEGVPSAYCSLRGGLILERNIKTVCESIVKTEEHVVPIVVSFDDTYVWNKKSISIGC